MKKTFLGIIGSVFILPIYSQHYIKGTIIDSENAMMPMVNVAFLNQSDSTLVTGASQTVHSSPALYLTLAEYIIHLSMRATISSVILIWVMRRCIRIYRSIRISHCRWLKWNCHRTCLKEWRLQHTGNHSSWIRKESQLIYRILFLPNRLHLMICFASYQA